MNFYRSCGLEVRLLSNRLCTSRPVYSTTRSLESTDSSTLTTAAYLHDTTLSRRREQKGTSTALYAVSTSAKPHRQWQEFAEHSSRLAASFHGVNAHKGGKNTQSLHG